MEYITDGLMSSMTVCWANVNIFGKNKIRTNQFKRKGLKERTQLYLALGNKEKVKIVDFSGKAGIQHKKSRGT